VVADRHVVRLDDDLNVVQAILFAEVHSRDDAQSVSDLVGDVFGQAFHLINTSHDE